MAQKGGLSNEGLSNDGLESRMAIAEELLNKIVAIHVSTATHVQNLGDKLNRLDTTASAISNFMRKIDMISNRMQDVESNKRSAVSDSAEIQNAVAKPVQHLEARLQKTEEMVADIHRQLATLLERLPQSTTVATTEPVAPVGPVVVDKLNELSRMPDFINKFESQQSTILQALERRTDPRLMIYLKPLIEMLEEEGRQAEHMKDAALKQLNAILTGERSGTDQQIAHMLQNVGTEIEKCQAAFDRTQQALQMVVSPFQNVGRLFRDNLDIIVQAHDLLAELHADLPRFLDEMKAVHEARRQR
ncbi:MAG: hypothetical protein HQL60_00880 [Magnetococcales bacterium]|nr:hypothetical protein [Magnetococcales bacterium]